MAPDDHRRFSCRMQIGGLILLSVVVVGVPASGAQDDEVYAGASVLVSTQHAADPGQGSSVAKPGLGGTSIGISGEFGTFVARMLSLAFEASVPARFDTMQFTGIPTSRIESQHRDLVLSGLFHVHAPSSGPIRFAAIAGASVIREDTLRRVAFASFGSTAFGPFTEQRALTHWTVGVTVGAEVAVQLGGHVQLVPQIRVHWIERARLGSTGGGLVGLSPWVTRPAVGVRAVF
jgi:hypothetical protein